MKKKYIALTSILVIFAVIAIYITTITTSNVQEQDKNVQEQEQNVQEDDKNAQEQEKKEAKQQFKDYISQEITDEESEILTSAFYDTNDIVGWIFFKKESNLYMNLALRKLDNATGEKSIVGLTFPVSLDSSLFNNENEWSLSLASETEDSINIDCKQGDETLLSINVFSRKEDSDGEAKITVSNNVTNDVYYTNEDLKVESGVYTKQGSSDSEMGDFTITINEDGTFTSCESPLSSYIGMGTYDVDGDILILTEDADGSNGSVNQFLITDDGLEFIEESSTNYSMVPLQDGDLFELTENVEAK